MATALAAGFAAQPILATQQAPPPTQSTTTASIRGTVQDATGAAPTGVSIVVFPADQTAWPGAAAARTAQRVRVDAGKYAVTGLPAGNYRLLVVADAEMADWPSPELLQKLSGRKPMPVTLGAGEEVTIDARVSVAGSDVSIVDARLMRTLTESVLQRGGLPVAPARGLPPRATYPGSISGRVVDADGRPVAGAVMLSLKRGSPGGALLPFHERGFTNADGTYKLNSRSPGDYFVVAVPWDLESGGEGLSVRRGPPVVAGDDGVKRDHVATFHGGVTTIESAPPVTVTNDERTNIDIKLVRRPVFDLLGVIEDGPAQPDPSGRGGFPTPRSAVSLTPVGAEPFGGALSRRVSLAADKTFVGRDLPAGEYRILWSSPGGYVDQFATVGGSAVTSVRLKPRTNVQVTGRAEFRGDTPPPVQMTLPQFGVEVRPTAVVQGSTFTRVLFAPDRTFSVAAIGAGPFRVTAVAAAPWVQIEGMVNGLDSMDLPVQAGSGFKDVVVVFADKPTALSIEVVDADDKPVQDARVLLFTEDTRYWSVRSRRAQIGQPNATGVWTPSNLPPAKYLVVASRQIAAGATINAALVGSFLSRAKPIELGLGETKTVRVRVE